MARKAIVDRAAVLEMLKQGMTSQAIADRFGVSRQAIDLHRKQFTAAGLLVPPQRHAPAPAPAQGRAASREQRGEAQSQISPAAPGSADMPPLSPIPSLSLDQLIDLIIQAFTALKRIPELEKEFAALRKSYEAALQQIQELNEREQKRREQELRWLRARVNR